MGSRARRPRGLAVRLREQQWLPRTLSLEQVAAVIDAQRRLRDRLLFALLASTGMRIGQALNLRHDDHPTAADLRRALDERGVLDRVADLVA